MASASLMPRRGPREPKRAPAFDWLVAPMRMRVDDPATIAAQIWRAVGREADSVYAKGAERLFVFVQKFAPKMVDRAIATQMADPRIREYLDKRHGAVTPTGHREDVKQAAKDSTDPKGKPTAVPAGVAQPA